MPANFPMLLAELKRKNSMTVLKKYYQDEWEFYDLLIGLTNHKDFKQACIDKSFSEDFKNDLDHYIKLTNQAREAISKYFKRKDIELQAYYTKTNGALNINLINYDRSEPMKISDILQQEKNISELNIYCNKKHDIHAYRKDEERHYEFTKGAYYEMTSTWPADKSGKTLMCTMVMSVSNDGITKIEEFNGKKFNDESDKLLSEEDMKLIEQNKELYIQGLSLYDAVKALLEKNKNAPLPDVVLTANNNLQNKKPISVNRDEKLEEQKAVVPPEVVPNEPTSVNQDEKVDGQLDLKNDAPRFPTNNDTSTQIETDKRIAELERQNNDSQNILERAKQTIEELNKQNDSLQDKLEMEEKKHEKLQAELKQKDEELASISANLQEKTQELENMREEKENLKKKLEAANAKVQGLESELEERKKDAEEVEQIISQNCQQKKHLDSLMRKVEELKNELESEREQKEQLLQEREEMLSECSLQLAPKFKEYEDEIEKLTEIIADKTQTIENLQSKLQDKEEGEFFRNQTKVWKEETHSSINKQKASNGHAKTFYTLTGNIDVSEEGKSRSASPDSALYNDDEGNESRCSSALNSISYEQMCNTPCTSQSQCSNYSSVCSQNSFS